MSTTRFSVFFALSVASLSAQIPKHALRLDDLARVREVRDPQVSPDGQAVAFVVSTIDTKEDKANTHIWLASFDGKPERQITSSNDSESSPRWSPDGKILAFTSGRPGPAKGTQVWLMDRNGGEAIQLTDMKGRLQGFEWSPDAKKMAMVVGDADPEADAPAGAPARAPKPIVIDRYKYKQDVQGYLLSGRHSYIYIYDLATKKLDRLTTQKTWDEAGPVWSPDGTRIAFTSNHHNDPDRDPANQVFVAEAKAGATEKQLTKEDMLVTRARVEWSPDGKQIAFLTTDERKYDQYSMSRLGLVASDGSAAATMVKAAADLDRGVNSPRFAPDGKSIAVIVTDDRSVYPARVPVSGGSAERLMASPVVVQSPSTGGVSTVVLSNTPKKLGEVYALEGGSLRQITHQNDELLKELDLPDTELVSFKSKDGTDVNGLLTYPVGYVKGTRVPFILRIHGGPNGQDQYDFAMERQVFAANGYAVLNVNYRGSAGRGRKFSWAIAGDWGNHEVADLEAGIDYAIKLGVADPEHMGVGGWSYGGILTDYMIATDHRLKAATSGAGTAFPVSFYGTDQYIIQYDYEIGPPWDAKAWETYQKISYPFLHADRIKTPTLFLGGERDFNVPVQGGQQMYQALRSLGIDTQLIIYPNEFHGITRPSYVRDRYERYLEWYAKYLKPAVQSIAAQ
jgi:dipeptidyl aminopeptidase/acylaminoacyl peptidase